MYAIFWFWLGGFVAHSCVIITEKNTPIWFKIVFSAVWPMAIIDLIRYQLKGINVNSGK